MAELAEPTIQKMSERKHLRIVTEDEPMHSPIRPPNDEFEDDLYEESDVVEQIVNNRIL